MSEDLWGAGEEEEEEEEVAGAPSAQAGDPPLAGRDPVGQSGGSGKSRSATAGEGGTEGTPCPPPCLRCQEPALLQWAAFPPRVLCRLQAEQGGRRKPRQIQGTRFGGAAQGSPRAYLAKSPFGFTAVPSSPRGFPCGEHPPPAWSTSHPALPPRPLSLKVCGADHQPPTAVSDMGRGDSTRCPPPTPQPDLGLVGTSGCRTLSHPSFQPFYSAVLGSSRCPQPPPPEGPAWEAGPPSFLDCSSFFYTDPTQPPGSRIYNWLSCCSLEVLHRLPLDIPAPIMAPRETPPAPGLCTRRRWLSREELQAACALLDLPGAAQGGPQADSGDEQGGP